MRNREIIVTSALLLLVQSAVLPFIWPFLPLPDLWLVTVILLTFFYGPSYGLPAALIGGLMTDIITGTLVGGHLLVYLAAVALLRPFWRILQNHLRLTFLAVFFVSLLAGECGVLVAKAAGAEISWLRYFWGTALPQAVMNAPCSVLLHLWWRPQRERYRDAETFL